MTHPQDPADPPAPPGEFAAPPEPADPWTGPWPTVLAVAGLGLAALVLRPTDALAGGGSGPFDRNVALTVLLGIAWMVCATALYRYYRRTAGSLNRLPARAERLRDATLVLLRVAVPALPLLLFLAYHRRPGVPKVRHPQLDPDIATPPDSPAHSTDFTALLLVALESALLLLLLIGAIRFWRGRRRRPATVTRSAERPTEEEGLADAVSSGLRALHGSDARAAVIACYAAMEQSLGSLGIGRRLSDSPTDLLERVVANGAVRRAEARALTTLFQEARYSSHPMDRGHLEQARAALDAIALQLAERAERDAAERAEQAAPDAPDAPDAANRPEELTT